MRRFLRPLGLLMTLVFLQLVLVESGYACQVESAVAGGAAMAGMPMPNDGARSPSSSEPQGQPHSPCQFPWMPSGCQLLSSCGVSMTVAASASTGLQLIPARVAPPVLEALEPLSLSIAPELPPPRA